MKLKTPTPPTEEAAAARRWAAGGLAVNKTLRDEIAMAALTAIVDVCRADTMTGRTPEQYFAGRAYALADAMLAERAKEPKT